jgi:hypothetical protein
MVNFWRACRAGHATLLLVDLGAIAVAVNALKNDVVEVTP